MTTIHPPAPAPCGSCPYRRDVPSGVWDRDEYEKLPDYDEPTYAQPTGVFLCHQQDGRVCAGWCGTHDMENTLALRLAAAAGSFDSETLAAIIDYTTSVPLFTSGREAHDHGVADFNEPGRDAVRMSQKLAERRRGVFDMRRDLGRVPTAQEYRDEREQHSVKVPAHEVESRDAPHPSGEDRYAIYAVTPPSVGPNHPIGTSSLRPHQRLAETSRDGIGLTLCTLRDEGQITNDSRVGILDRETRAWIVNPWGKGGAA